MGDWEDGFEGHPQTPGSVPLHCVGILNLGLGHTFNRLRPLCTPLRVTLAGLMDGKSKQPSSVIPTKGGIQERKAGAPTASSVIASHSPNACEEKARQSSQGYGPIPLLSPFGKGGR